MEHKQKTVVNYKALHTKYISVTSDRVTISHRVQFEGFMMLAESQVKCKFLLAHFLILVVL